MTLGPLTDVAMAMVLGPELFGGRQVNVCVETGDGLTAGMSVVHWRRVTGGPANALVLREVSAPAFHQLLTSKLRNLPCPLADGGRSSD